MFPTTPYMLIRLDPAPTRLGGNTKRLENYSYQYTGKDPDLVEINYLLEGSVIVPHEEGPVTYPQGSIRVFTHGATGLVTSPDPVLHEIYLNFRCVQLPEPMEEADVAAWRNTVHHAILPTRVDDPTVCERAALIMRTVSRTIRDEDCIALSLRARTCLYEILTIFTEYCVRTARQKQAARQIQSPYTKKACRYIREHLGDKFAVTEVAQAAGISYNHLKAVFQQDMNMSLVEYANRERIRRVEYLLAAEDLSLEEAGNAVGIHDVKYLSRLFRRYTGMTCSEYRKTYRQ